MFDSEATRPYEGRFFAPERFWRVDDEPSYWLTRIVLIRSLGFVYLVAFGTIVAQGLPLFGSEGLTPASLFLERVADGAGSRFAGFQALPSLFWLNSSDVFLLFGAWMGMALSVAVVIGYANGFIFVELWLLYMSFVHIGQDWYAFGWETQLLETGFLAIFLCAFWDSRSLPSRPPPILVIWLYRWLVVRIMLGAGLIKLRGDSCWTDLTCLSYHYETQPVPNPLSPYLHAMPEWFHKISVLVNHFVELVVPLFVVGPRRLRLVAGVILVAFQAALIASGNLSFLNWLTIVPVLACFDDRVLGRILPARLIAGLDEAKKTAAFSPAQIVSVSAVSLMVLVASVNPISNLLSPRQAMNTSFDRLHLVNSYGAFGSVGRERLELIFEGSASATPASDDDWSEYEFKCKPGSVERRPCLISPYHYRLDWLLWFAAMGGPDQYPWTLHLIWKLLHNDAAALSLLDDNPFGDTPPRYIRVQLFRYRYADSGQGAVWQRERLRSWLPPLNVNDVRFTQFLESRGWLR